MAGLVHVEIDAHQCIVKRVPINQAASKHGALRCATIAWEPAIYEHIKYSQQTMNINDTYIWKLSTDTVAAGMSVPTETKKNDINHKRTCVVLHDFL